MLATDYSQIELRLMAHFSQDDALVHAFQHGQDVHRRTAAEVLGIAIEDVTNDQRRQAKAVISVYFTACRVWFNSSTWLYS